MAAVLPFALLGVAAPAAAGTASTTDVGVATCEWVVVWPTAGVYEQPTRMYAPLKTKHSGDRVGGGYCMSHYNTSEQEWYVSVTCACAADDIGWMRQNALRPA